MSILITKVKQKRKQRKGLYEDFVRCNGCINGKWVLRSSLRPGQVRCDDCNQLFRTGPKTLELKKRYDDNLTRY